MGAGSARTIGATGHACDASARGVPVLRLPPRCNAPECDAMIRAFQWDLARQVERLDWLVAQLPRYADWGYEELHVHLEDAVEYPRLPGIARKDAYSYKEFGRLVDAATKAGIKVVPIVNLLGHTQYLIKVPELRDLNELRAADGSPLERGQICPLHPKTLEVAGKLLRDMAPFCTAGKVHVGLDESFHLGKHPLSKIEIAQIGLAAHFAGHVNRLRDLTRSLDLRMGMWADMLCFIPDAIPLLPHDLIAYDWYYFPFSRLPRVEMLNFVPYDLARPLQAHGIEYWGCAMNGSFRYEPLPLFGDRIGNIRSWWDRCSTVGAGGLLISSWEPHRLAMEMTTVVDAAAACHWLEPGISRPADMLAKGFERALGVKPGRSAAVARTALQCDRHSFTGYARWEINDRWDCTAPREPLAVYAQGERFYRNLAKRNLPEPFEASAAFLGYIYARDTFVRRAARGVFQLRRAQARDTNINRILHKLSSDAESFGTRLHHATRAAAAMWNRTRRNSRTSPNGKILRLDRDRLGAWKKWLSRCRQTPRTVHTSSTVAGIWQLQLRVQNFEPALQKVIIEQAQPDGTWRELHTRFTIEFSAKAAMPRSNFEREFSVPVTLYPKTTPKFRVGLRGLGRVRIHSVELSDGVTLLPLLRKQGPRGKLLGKRVRQKGFPALDWDTNADEIELSFVKRERCTP